jgi:hypothetical protein
MYAFRARPGFVSSWFMKLAVPATSTVPERLRVRASATSGIPASLRIPVVLHAARCALKPRSCPLQRSSARPIAATAPTAGPVERLQASRRAAGACLGDSPRVGLRRGLRRVAAAAVREPGDVTTGRAVVEVDVDLPTLSPARSASIVIRTSQPNPGASGKHTARARSLRRRWPESGSRAAKPSAGG